MFALRRRVIVTVGACALGVVALLACGDDELCDTECAGGRLTQTCCKAGATCADIAPFCDLGGGRCTTGDCTADGGDDAPPDGTLTDVRTPCGFCPLGTACIVTHFGATCVPPDPSGHCPNGTTTSEMCCDKPSSTTYQCVQLPASCFGVPGCTCAAGLCTCNSGGATCQPSNDPLTLSCECP